ncbi:hypothetical protein [Chroococcus sp. FPU101]|uniref:hypothetical protein n=1 Tax=Chroococcus sp. FPU101 TaxID=1974212 RepID=UPI001A8D3688|nr:hypothetical protein [Chroococcus sp. FPU101]GFE69088.1 hypothetical protein CFPU101_16980 [Chroococcus sp. FPU101]
MSKIRHILYIDTNLERVSLLLSRFNPPLGIDLKLLENLQLKYIFTYCESFVKARQLIALHNCLPLAYTFENNSLQPFDGILIEIQGSITEQPELESFLTFVGQLTMESSLIPDLFALGREKNIELLQNYMVYGIRYFFQSPFDFKDLEKVLDNHFALFTKSKWRIYKNKTKKKSVESFRFFYYEGSATKSLTIPNVYYDTELDGVVIRHLGLNLPESEVEAINEIEE